MIKYLLFFLASTTISLLITPLIRLVAIKLNILDLPSKRKIHKKPMPLLGGIPIFIAFNLTIFLGILFNFEYLEKFYTSKWMSIFIAQVIILGIGIYDDIKKAKPWVKFLFQIFAGSLLIVAGFGIHIITNPFICIFLLMVLILLIIYMLSRLSLHPHILCLLLSLLYNRLNPNHHLMMF